MLIVKYADMAELADALDSGSSECEFVQVQVLLSAPSSATGRMVCRLYLYTESLSFLKNYLLCVEIIMNFIYNVF